MIQIFFYFYSLFSCGKETSKPEHTEVIIHISIKKISVKDQVLTKSDIWEIIISQWVDGGSFWTALTKITENSFSLFLLLYIISANQYVSENAIHITDTKESQINMLTGYHLEKFN